MRGEGRIDIDLPADSLVRHVRGTSPGSWRLDSGESGGFSVESQGFSTVSVDSWSGARPGPLPVKLASRRLDEKRIEITLDTRGLPPGSGCWLVTPFGQQFVQSGLEKWRLELPLPRLPQAPGLGRILAWRRALSEKQGPRQLAANLLGEPWDKQIRSLVVYPEGGRLRADLDQLAWLGLLQMPMGMRSALGMQGVLIFENAGPEPARDSVELDFTRLCFPLEAEP
jgi:hypothetical protein